MKAVFTSLALLLCCGCFCQKHSVTLIWETDTVLAIPESVLPGFKDKVLYVSLIDGQGWDNDRRGEIARLSLDGKIIDTTWITGLNAPKGMGRIGQLLYIADNSEVAVMDMTKGAVIHKISIEGAKGLNDITVDQKTHTVYVSDSRTSKIWKITHGKPVLYLDHVKGPNGLKFANGALLFAEGKSLMKANAQKKITKIAEVPAGIDGIEPIGNGGDILVTGWAGYLFYVYPNGRYETLLDTRSQKRNAADIGYDKKNKIIYIPSFNGKTVAAYQLK